MLFEKLGNTFDLLEKSKKFNLKNLRFDVTN